MNKKIVLAIVGLPGAGKTEATNYILQKTNWPKVYFGGAIVLEAANRGKPGEAGEREVREEYRAKYGFAAMAIVNMQKIKELYEQGDVVLESMYGWEEYLELKKEFGDNFKVLAIYASPETRTQRMVSRPERPLTAEQLISRDYSQIENLHQAGPIARANWTIVNEGSLEELKQGIDKILELIKSTN